jgi:itaconate CoA-transferase
VHGRPELHAEIEAVISGLSSEETIERLEGAGIANARMRTVQGFLDHPPLTARARWREVASPVGPLPALTPPATLDGDETVMLPVPEVGEHTATILTKLGYEDGEIAAFRGNAAPKGASR